MKIQIRERKRTIFYLCLPNFLLTSKLAAKIFLKSTRQNGQATPENKAPSLQEQIKQPYESDSHLLENKGNFTQEEIQNARACMEVLKKYVKKHGHFTLVEVQSTDCSVRIRV